MQSNPVHLISKDICLCLVAKVCPCINISKPVPMHCTWPPRATIIMSAIFQDPIIQLIYHSRKVNFRNGAAFLKAKNGPKEKRIRGTKSMGLGTTSRVWVWVTQAGARDASKSRVSSLSKSLFHLLRVDGIDIGSQSLEFHIGCTSVLVQLGLSGAYFSGLSRLYWLAA